MTYGKKIAEIKKWAGKNDLKRYLLFRELCYVGQLGVDSEQDISTCNEYAFDAILDLSNLTKALLEAQAAYKDKEALLEDTGDIFAYDERI